jgi:RHS repeat-associated protein
VVNVSYDGNGQVAGLTLGATPILQNIQYFPFTQAESWTWGNGQPHSRAFDQNGRLAAYPLGNRTRALAYDPASRITDYTDSDTSQSQHFEYDPLSRLLSAAINPTAALGAGQTLESFGYDFNGNRVSETVQTGATLLTSYGYSSTSNQLTQVAPQGSPALIYSYDAAGNTLSDGRNSFTYGDRGRLTAANTSQYAINGLGQRVQKNTPQGITLFTYDDAGHLIGEYTSTGKPIRETIYLGDTPVAVITGGVVSYIHADHLNAPRAIVDATGKTVWRWDSEPFGTGKPNEDPDGDKKRFTYNLRFPGQYYDAETGLHYNYFRDYSPSLGRYLESDPIGLKGGINTFSYAALNPAINIDKFGLDIRLYCGFVHCVYEVDTGNGVTRFGFGPWPKGGMQAIAIMASLLGPSITLPGKIDENIGYAEVPSSSRLVTTWPLSNQRGDNYAKRLRSLSA